MNANIAPVTKQEDVGLTVHRHVIVELCSSYSVVSLEYSRCYFYVLELNTVVFLKVAVDVRTARLDTIIPPPVHELETPLSNK